MKGKRHEKWWTNLYYSIRWRRMDFIKLGASGFVSFFVLDFLLLLLPCTATTDEPNSNSAAHILWIRIVFFWLLSLLFSHHFRTANINGRLTHTLTDCQCQTFNGTYSVHAGVHNERRAKKEGKDKMNVEQRKKKYLHGENRNVTNAI